MRPFPAVPHRHSTLRVVACAALAVLGAMITVGFLVALFLAHLSFFGEPPQVPLGHTILLLTGAAAGCAVPLLVAVLVLDTWRRRLVVAATMAVALLLDVLLVLSVLGV